MRNVKSDKEDNWREKKVMKGEVGIKKGHVKSEEEKGSGGKGKLRRTEKEQTQIEPVSSVES